MTTESKVGVIYLLHFDEPFHHAKHYLGFCESYEGLESRFAYHANGTGSRLLRAVNKAGIKWRCVRLWEGTRHDERRMKNKGASTPYCPACRGTPWQRQGLKEIDL